MKVHLRLLLLAAVLTGAVSAGNASAQDDGSHDLKPYYPGTSILELGVGYGRWIDSNAPSGSFGFGAIYHYFLSTVVATGFNISADQLGEITPEDGSDPFRFRLASFLGQVGFHYPGQTFSPYVAFGGGAYLLNAGGESEGSLQSRWGWMARTGFRMVGWSPIPTLDARYSYVPLNSETDLGLPGNPSSIQTISVKAGLSWLF